MSHTRQPLNYHFFRLITAAFSLHIIATRRRQFGALHECNERKNSLGQQRRTF